MIGDQWIASTETNETSSFSQHMGLVTFSLFLASSQTWFQMLLHCQKLTDCLYDTGMTFILE